MENAVSTGAYFSDQLTKVSEESPDWVTNVRGRGLCLAFDVDFDAGTDVSRAKLVGEMKKRGVNVPYCGLNPYFLISFRVSLKNCDDMK